jgi:hypothetical protein
MSPRFPVLPVLALLFFALPADADEAEEFALKTVERLGGRVRRDE